MNTENSSGHKPPLREANGFLFIGDVHLTTRRPGRRKDVSFQETVFKKLDQAVEICNQRQLIPVLSGDVFHRAVEESEALKTTFKRRFVRPLWTPPIAEVGNHDMKGIRLADSDTLCMIAEGLFTVCDTSGPVEEFMINGVRVGLGATPYGQKIPMEVGSLFPLADGIIWLTHHDIAFDGAYPGAISPFEIEGCSLLINGHMHLFKEPVQVGSTLWCNIGSITRTAIDAINYEPAVWEFSPVNGMTRHVLKHEKDVFDLTGSLIDEISPGEHCDDDEEISSFVDLLAASLETNTAATPEGELLMEVFTSKFEQLETSPAVQAIVTNLLHKVTDEQKSAA
ncbi:metallophosphoesterase [Thalassospira xiamenensis]|uniref:Calcineurin-like phosphoesterase n=1 Tax=Thalassospira xiamenensis TaxID=220697 RepID=A0A285TTS0_9PROT|nr:metallophosphoesterase [Thalassospira xiamenensis]SOC27195.1 Calcineurin-like phosphoesterase [Thalassospira xiamenensis]